MLENNEKCIDTYTKDILIKNVARKSKLTIDEVKEAVHLLEDEIFEILSTTSEDKDVSIRLFEGMTIDATFVPSKKKMNNLIGKEIEVPGKIKPKVNITRYYVNNLNKQLVI